MPGFDGPALADLGTIAEVKVPEGCHFLGAEDSRRFLEENGNISSNRELGTVLSSEPRWFVVFEYSDEGHIKDDDKDDLDADEIWKMLKSGNEAGNEERKRRGWPAMNLIGWATKPHYDEATRNLEWAIRAASEAGESINHNTRILGRTGVMEVTLVCDPKDLELVLPDYKKFLGGFGYKSGQRYAEYRAGDKLATYGLAALVAGGAGVLAAKTGLFAKLWKFLVAAVLGLVALVKRLFGRKPKPTESI
ncbi:MAG: DUF2167 domain-containing protein [Planctomycetota bacterium]